MALDATMILPAIFFTVVAVIIGSILFKKKPVKEAPKNKHHEHEEAPARSVEVHHATPSEPLEIPVLVNHPIFGTTVSAEAEKKAVKKVEEPVAAPPVVEDVGVVEQPAVVEAVVEAVQAAPEPVPVVEATPEPVVEPAPEPCEPVAEPVEEPLPAEPTPEPEPIVEAAPVEEAAPSEPAPEPVAEPIPEPEHNDEAAGPVEDDEVPKIVPGKKRSKFEKRLSKEEMEEEQRAAE
ncbi:hypothetical protein AALO_G00283140 [Alosa alosa]|uniref:Matrix-remodeling-associated protein 7 n=1 Tax=Alosa alosa TaxID=278164 RepID=A0AAV6FJV6_9TELE|nr:hypothetical protein AALO_G00283140 [Alosa alosa]